MNCKEYRAEIEGSDFAAGRDAARPPSHADGCAVCRDFRDETAAVRRLVAGLARVDAPPDFEFRLRARLGAADSARPRAWAQTLWPQTLLPRAAAFAAAGCLALAAALALQTRNPRPAEALTESVRPTVERAAAGTAANANAETAAREVPGEKTDEVPAAELTDSRAGSKWAEPNETVATRRKVRGAAVAAASAAAKRAPRGLEAVAAAAQSEGEMVAPGGAGGGQTETRTLSMTGSPVIVTSAIPLPVSADERPLQVLFKDTQGESHVVNVAPVTFGSNEPAARPANVTFTKAAKKKHGVW